MTPDSCVLCGSTNVYEAARYVDMFDVPHRNLSCRDCGQDWTAATHPPETDQ